VDGRRPPLLQRPRRPEGYAKINLQPGYQRLTGYGRSTSSVPPHGLDIYRNARQQLFVRRSRTRSSIVSLTKLPQLIKVITSNVEVGQGGGKDVSAKTVLRTRRSRTRCRRARLPARIEGSRASPT
jgi:hypothetical protein